MSTNRLSILFLLNILAVLSLCGFTFRISADLGTLDWGYGEVSPVVVQQLMEGLTTSGPKGEAMPALASQWRSNAASTEFVFKLRQGAKWSDGEPVCAKHFVDAWLRVLSPEFASPYAHYLHDLANAREFHSGALKDASKVGVQAVGCHELRVKLAHPAAFFPALASHWVLNPIRLDLLKAHGREWIKPGKLAVTGPYLLERWEHDKELVLARNPLYYGRKPEIEKLRALVVGDDATAQSLFATGKIDWLKDVPFLDKPKLAAHPDYRVYDSFVGYHLGFDVRALDRDARCALALALDLREIPKVLQGGETPAAGLVPPGLFPRKRGEPRFDPVKARSLWQKVAAEKRPVEAQYYAKDIHSVLMQWAQQQWRKNLGADIRLVKTEPKTYWAQLPVQPPKVFLSGITAAYAHPYSFLSEFLSTTSANYGHFASPSYDKLAIKSAATPVAKAGAVVASAEKILLDDECGAVPLYFRKTSAMVSGKWQGVHVNPMTFTYLKDVTARSAVR